MGDIRGFTCTGVSLGSILVLKDITTPDLDLSTERIHLNGDSNNAGTAYPIGHVDGPITLLLHWDATLYAALRAMAYADDPTTDTFTITKTSMGTWSGAAYVTKVGSMTFGADRKPEFSVTLEPSTQWTYTAP